MTAAEQVAAVRALCDAAPLRHVPSLGGHARVVTVTDLLAALEDK